MVTRTVVVNGSVLASQTRSSSSSLETTPPRALSSSSRMPNSLRVRSSGSPARVTVRWVWSRITSATTQHRRRHRRGPPAQRPDPGDQLLERERLGQVVVGAELQPLDPVGDGAARGQHEHPGQRPRGDQVGADLVAVHAGQVAVEHHHVVARHHRHLVPGRAVVGDVDGQALPAQPARDRVGEAALVLDHQYPHGATLTAGAPRPNHGDGAGGVAARTIRLSSTTATLGSPSNGAAFG